jgi:predicted acetyltransferase
MNNTASRKVIEANGGVLVDTFSKPDTHGGAPGLRFCIPLR